MLVKNMLLAITTMAVATLIVTMTAGQQVYAPRDCGSCVPFNFKVKECRVDTNPEPVSCKELKGKPSSSDILGTDFVLTLNHVGEDIVITLTPSEPTRQ